MNRETAGKVAARMEEMRVAEEAAAKARHALDQLGVSAAWRHREIIKAFSEGTEIQVKLGDRWADSTDPTFNFATEYRLKPAEPISFFASAYKRQDGGVNIGGNYSTMEGAVHVAAKGVSSYLGTFEFKQVVSK